MCTLQFGPWRSSIAAPLAIEGLCSWLRAQLSTFIHNLRAPPGKALRKRELARLAYMRVQAASGLVSAQSCATRPRGRTYGPDRRRNRLALGGLGARAFRAVVVVGEGEESRDQGG